MREILRTKHYNKQIYKAEENLKTCAIIIILFCIGLSILLLNIVKRINIDKLIIKEDIKNVKCDQDLENIKEIGNYEIKIIVDNNEYISKLIIYNNVIDKIELKEVTMSIDEELPSIKDFIVIAKKRVRNSRSTN